MSGEIWVDETTLLVILAERRGARACLDAALMASRAVDRAHVAALHVRVDPMTDIVPTEELLSDEQRRAMEMQAAREGDALHDIYASWMLNLPNRMLTSWYELFGGEAAIVQELGRQSHLNIMVNRSRYSGAHPLEAFRACLFGTGKPLLVVPDDYRASEVRKILIAWKDTYPARRALDAAQPWLRDAEDVALLRVGAESPLEVEWAQHRLAELGIRSETRIVPRDIDIAVGRQVLREAETFGADWIVAGAFRHGQLWEWILGGVTQSLLDEAKRPLFLMH